MGQAQFSFTYAGSPTLYYGDEIALSHDGVWANNKWEDDPYNRAPYPWPDATGSAYSPAADTLAFARKMASIRWSYPALQSGDVQHGLVIDDAHKLYSLRAPPAARPRSSSSTGTVSHTPSTSPA